jgi:hypothetical protein
MVLLLLAPYALLAAPPPDAPPTTGLWKVEGEVMGTPVKMMCNLTESDHKLSGVCSGEQDGYAAHKIVGTVKAQKVEFYFQTAFGGNSLTLIVSGTLNEDRSRIDGGLDIEPMAVGGAFSAIREAEDAANPGPPANDTPAPADTPAATTSAAQPTGPTPSPEGAWEINGDVQGTPVQLTCVLTKAELKLTGTCANGDLDKTPHALTGAILDKGLAWRFDTEYQAQPITVSMKATVSPDGATMRGTIAVAPMDAAGTFTGVKQ